MSKTILITGSSSGIGKAAAKRFAEKGWNVIATMRTPEKETELTELENVTVAQLDVQDVDNLQNKIDSFIEQAGGIDVVLNNAGYAIYGPLEGTTEQQMVRQYDVNVFGLIRITQAFIPHFRERQSGLFLNVSSMGGRMTFPLISLYHSTKFAVEGFSESLHFELEPLGIGVKLIEPGAIATEFGGASMDFSQQDTDAYKVMMEKVMEAWANGPTPSSSDMVADVIFDAATDGKSQMRYIAGTDAEQFITLREKEGYEVQIQAIKQHMGL